MQKKLVGAELSVDAPTVECKDKEAKSRRVCHTQVKNLESRRQRITYFMKCESNMAMRGSD